MVILRQGRLHRVCPVTGGKPCRVSKLTMRPDRLGTQPLVLMVALSRDFRPCVGGNIAVVAVLSLVSVATAVGSVVHPMFRPMGGPPITIACSLDQRASAVTVQRGSGPAGGPTGWGPRCSGTSGHWWIAWRPGRSMPGVATRSAGPHRSRPEPPRGELATQNQMIRRRCCREPCTWNPRVPRRCWRWPPSADAAHSRIPPRHGERDLGCLPR